MADNSRRGAAWRGPGWASHGIRLQGVDFLGVLALVLELVRGDDLVELRRRQPPRLGCAA